MKCKVLLLITSMALIATSCIKEEGLFREADIKAIEVDSEHFRTAVFSTDDSNIIQLIVSAGANYKSLTPIIKVSEGATISPASGVVQDFSKAVTYTVVSEDKQYQREYKIIAVPDISLKASFDSWTFNNYFYIYDDATWDSANNGVRWAGGAKDGVYPTRPTDDAYKGETAVLLETQKGVKGILVGNKPIFAGNIFRGKFAVNPQNHIRSAKFGIIHPEELGKPLSFNGYYKYKSGAEYQEFKDGEITIVPGKLDECDLYAVVYRITKGADQTEFVYGDNIHTAENIIARAALEDRTEKAGYTPFDISFTYTGEMDYTKYDYKLAVVLASSRRGDYFEGSIGSTLIVDEVEVVCETKDGKKNGIDIIQ